MADRLNKAQGLEIEEKKEKKPIREKIASLRKKYIPSKLSPIDDEDEPKKYSMAWESRIAGEPRKK